MADRDRPYQVERPDQLRRKWDQCAVAGLDRTRGPDWGLRRWKVVHELIVGWYGDSRPDAEAVPDLMESLAAWLDPVQRLLVERLFAGWRAMFPKEPGLEVDLDPPAQSVFDHEAMVELRVRPTIGFTRPDGSVERVRLRTGRRPSSLDDAVVLTHEAGNVTHLDALVAAGVAEEVVAPEDPDRVIGELADLSRRPVDRGRDRHPGPWCFSCSSAPRCGQYPLTRSGRVYVSTRSLTVSKTQLGWLDTCRRRVAWDRLHSVRIDDGSDLEVRRGAATGIIFHETAAAAILADDPDPVVAAACRGVAPSEAADLQRLWGNHVALWEADGSPDARATEYPAGVTLMVPGIHIDSRGRRSEQPVAVTMIGILDVTGRERDGTPMVVEHRTGSSSEHGHLELDLYAVSAAETVRARSGEWPENLAVHLHVLGGGEPECRRTPFGASDLEASMARLTAAAQVIAAWDPDDSLDPSYSVGPWCTGCHHREVCETFR